MQQYIFHKQNLRNRRRNILPVNFEMNKNRVLKIPNVKLLFDRSSTFL